MRIKAIGFVILIFLLGAQSKAAQSDQMKIFFTSCTYGVLAGTLVGAATLAFTQKPGDNLNNIARGASLGLYGGILLGAYVVYGVPSGDSEDEYYEEGEGDGEAPPEEAFRPLIYPIISKNGIDGAAFSLKVLSF